jgi:hypothetical protein
VAQGRDLTRDAMVTVADRMSERYVTSGKRISVASKRSIRRWTVEEGLAASDTVTEVFEVVRVRPLFGNSWRVIQPVQTAAARIGAFVRDDPGSGRDSLHD